MLNGYRSEIDKIDDQIVNLLNKRFSLVKEIGLIKNQANLLIGDDIREAEIIAKVSRNAKVPSGLIEDLYEVIFKYSRIIQC